MATTFEEYLDLVQHVEGPDTLATYAKSSFEPFEPSSTFLGGEDIRSYYQEYSAKGPHKLDLRTPLQRERDRIVHSSPLRSLAEKFHVLYYRDQRITRNYITHAMRMAQVARAICRGLRLNQDFAEAIALGSKVGTTPFKHVANKTIASWIETSVTKLAGVDQKGLSISPHTLDFPPWISECPATQQDQIRRGIPAARMKNDVDRGYSAGKQSYLLLMTNPYSLESTPARWYKETAYAIWRHSLHEKAVPESAFRFSYEWPLDKSRHEFSWMNDTYEAMVVRLADDITWVVENLQDANHARILSSQGQQDLFAEIHSESLGKLDDAFLNALAHKDPSQLYDFFIGDCVETTRRSLDDTLARHKDWLEQRQALRSGDKDAPLVGLSDEGYQALARLKGVLFEHVFGDPRTENRNKVLGTILEFVARQLFNPWPGSVASGTSDWITQRSRRYPVFRPDEVLRRANVDPYFRLQLVVNIMSEMTDSDVFQMVGMGMI